MLSDLIQEVEAEDVGSIVHWKPELLKALF